jgi:hypothetical protein
LRERFSNCSNSALAHHLEKASSDTIALEFEPKRGLIGNGQAIEARRGNTSSHIRPTAAQRFLGFFPLQ